MNKRVMAARMVSALRVRAPLARMLPRKGVLILNYHRIGDGSGSTSDRGLWSADEDGFDAQLDFLKHNCDVISLGDLQYALDRDSGRYVAITFDDGYQDNYRTAFPALMRHGLPAAFFIATGFIDTPRLPWWDEIAVRVNACTAATLDMRPWIEAPLPLSGTDRTACINALLRCYKSLPEADTQPFLAVLRQQAPADVAAVAAALWMDWDMLRDMASAGMTIGGHTVNHPVLSRLSAARQHEELATGASRLEREVGRPMRYFAYPVGSRWAFNADTRACLEALGVERAFSYYGGTATRHSDRYDTPRVAIESHIDADMFRAMTQLPQVFCRRPDE